MSYRPAYVSTATVARDFRSLSDQLTALTEAGIQNIELGWSPPCGSLSIPRGLGAFNAQWLVHNYFPAPTKPFVLNLASQDPALLQRSRDFATAAIRLSAELGAPFYSVHCGFLAEFDPSSLGRQLNFSEICEYERGYSTFCSSLQLLLTAARNANIKLLVEPNVVAPFNLIDGRNILLMLAEPHEFTRLFSDISDERLGVLLDLGHLKVTAQTLGFKGDDFVEAVCRSVRAFHLHDNDGTADQHKPAVANSWVVEVVKQSRFAGLPVVVEAKFDGVAALSQYYVWLKRILNP